MKAVQVVAQGDDTRLTWTDVDDPECGPDEVLVDVHATALNRADLMQRAGNYPPPPGESDILGLEAAGIVSETGTNVEGWRPGDRVCALLSGGGYAEKVSVPAQMLMPIPGHWTYEHAAAIPEVFLTAFVNLFMEAELGPDETVLIHGGASGVGTAAIQLARETGCRVFTTAGTPEKTERCSALGANLAVNYREDDFAERISEETGGRGVDVVLDMVGAPYLERNLSLLNTGGRIVYISVLGGREATLDLARLLRGRFRLVGSTLRARSLAEKVEIRNRFMDQFWFMLENGTITPVIDSVSSIQEAEASHARMAENGNIGKVILRVRE